MLLKDQRIIVEDKNDILLIIYNVIFYEVFSI